MLSLLIPEEIFHGEKNHRLFYSSKIRNSVRCRSKRDMYSKLVGGKNCWNDILRRDKILWKDEISVRWKRRWNIGGGRSNGEWIRYRRGSTTSQNCVDSRVEAEPRRSEIYIYTYEMLEEQRTGQWLTQIGNGGLDIAQVGQLGRNLVKPRGKDGVSVIRVEIYPNPMILDQLSRS